MKSFLLALASLFAVSAPAFADMSCTLQYLLPSNQAGALPLTAEAGKVPTAAKDDIVATVEGGSSEPSDNPLADRREIHAEIKVGGKSVSRIKLGIAQDFVLTVPYQGSGLLNLICSP